MSYFIGIDLGGSSVKSVAVTAQGQSMSTKIVPFDAASELDWARRISGLVEEIQGANGERADGIGLSAPGLASENGRSIAYMPGRLHGLEGLDWTAHLGRSRLVPVLNDAYAALAGEAWLGAARGFKNVILLTLGTGVGGAAMVDGRILRGHTGRAGHLGHISLDIDGPSDICRLPGSLEMAIGNCTVSDRTRGRFSSTHELVAAHLGGDGEAGRIWLRSVRGLACGVASLINVLDPEAVIIAGGISACGPALFGPLQSFLDEVEWRPGGRHVTLLPAQLGEYAGAFGAAHHALRHDSL